MPENDGSDLTKKTAAPSEVTLAGQRECIYPLRFMEWGQIEQWMRAQVISAAKLSMRGDPNLTEIERQEILAVAFKEARQLSLGRCFVEAKTDGIKAVPFLDTFEGMVRVIHLAIREGEGAMQKPKYTLAEINDKLQTNHTVLQDIFGQVMDLSFADDGDAPKNPAAASPNQ